MPQYIFVSKNKVFTEQLAKDLEWFFTTMLETKGITFHHHVGKNTFYVVPEVKLSTSHLTIAKAFCAGANKMLYRFEQAQKTAYQIMMGKKQ